MPVACDASPPNAAMNSPERLTLPTVIVGLPVSFFVQPARLSVEPSNSGSQKRRVEAWKQSTPASDNGFKNSPSCSGVEASFTVKSRSEEHKSELQSLMRISY